MKKNQHTTACNFIANVSSISKAIAFAIVCFICVSAKAQTYNAKLYTPVIYGGCIDTVFTLKYRSDTTHILKINAWITNGDTTCTVSSTNRQLFISIESSNSYVSTVVHDTLNGFFSCHVSNSGTDSVYIRYKVFIDCSVLKDTANLQSIVLHQSFSDSLNHRSFNVNGLGSQINTPALKIPIIRNSFTFQQFNISYLDSSYFEFRYENKSDLPANISFHFMPGDTTVCSHATTLGFAFADSANNNFQSFNLGNNINAFIPAHTYLYIRHYATLTNCMSSICTDTAKLYWQCKYPANTENIFCASCLNVTDAVYQVQNNENPILVIQPISPQNNYYNNFTCFNDTSNMLQWDYRIVHAASSIGTADTFSVTLLPHIAMSDKWLALIPESQIQVSVNCQQCTVNTDSVISSLPLLCTNYINDAIASYTISGLNFRHGDTIYFHVKVFRCAEENDAVLLNQGKYLNQWKLRAYAQGICPLKNNLTGAYLSKELEQYVGTPNISQNMVCFPSTNNLNVPSQQTWGDTMQLNVELNGLQALNIPLIYQYLACGDTNPPYNCKPSGLVRVRVALETGLVIMNPASQVFISGIYNSLSVTLTPVYYQDSVPDSVCMAGNYYFYFQASDTLLYLLTYGKLFCTVHACCPAKPSATHLQIAFHLMPNPNHCFTDSFPADHLSPPIISNVNAAYIPMSSFEFDFDIHCPGCLAPGIIVDRYRLKRTSFGLKDSDNDGIADNSLSPIANDTAYINSHDLKTFFSSYGDTLRDFMTSHFQDGDPTLGGYSYAMMKNLNAFVNYLQFKTTINVDTSKNALFPQQYVLYIDVRDSLSNTCLECKTFEVDTAFKTKLALSVPFASLNHYMTFDTLAGNYFFTFSTTDSLYSLFDSSFVVYRDTVNPFTSFEIGQRYRLATRYNECFHFDAPLYPNTIHDVEKTVEILNEAWLSGAWHAVGGPKMPNDTTVLDSLGWTFNQAFHPDDSLINQQFADEYIFYCEWNGGVHYFFSQDAYADNYYFSDDSSCGIKFIASAYCRTAGYFYYPYPYEFRPPSLYPATYDFYLPPGYHASHGIVSHTLWGAVSFTSPWLPVNIPSPDANRFIHIQLSDIPSTTCLQESSNIYDSVLFVSSYRLQKYLIIYLQPDSCSISTMINPDTTVTCTIGAMNTPCWHLAACNDSIKIDGDNIQLLHIAEANLQFNVIPNPTYAATNKLCWQVTLSNPKTIVGVLSGSNVYSTAAPNVFLITDSVSYLNNWSYTPNGSSIPILPTGNIIQIDNNIIVNGADTGMLCASYIYCIDSAYLQLIAGYNCTAMPDTPFVVEEQCHLLTDSIHLFDEPASFYTNGKTNPVSYSLCQPFIKTAEFYLTNSGSVYPDSIALINLPAELDLLSIKAQGCDTNIAPVTLAALNANTWSITPQQMDTMGFTEQALTDNQCERIKIIVTLEAGCNGTEINSLHDLVLYAHSYCNEPVSAQTNNCIFNWDSTSHCNDCFTITKTVDKNPVNALDTVTYSIIVCANNASSQSVYLEDILPVGFVPLTNPLPAFPTIPAYGCDTFLVTGYFQNPDTCPNTTDTARLITFAYNIDTLEATVCNTVNIPCYRNDMIFISDTLYSSLSLSPSDTVLYFENDFYFDQSVTLTNLHIYVAQGKQIFVMTGYTLILDNTIIEGCGYMWQGITVETGATIQYLNSALRDANTGINMIDGSYFKITDSRIIDCVTGLYIEPVACDVPSSTYGEVTGTTFGLIRPSFLTDYSGQPAHGKLPKAGIDVSDYIYPIGDDALHKNHFVKLTVGLTALRSSIRLYNSTFENIAVDTFYQRNYDGSAIVSRGQLSCGKAGNIVIYPLPVTATGTDTLVQNSFRGVYTNYSGLTITNNKILRVHTGIRSGNCTGTLSTNVKGCSIYASNRGLNWTMNEGANVMFADSNFIDISGDTTGIGINMTGAAGFANYQITGNTINITSGRNGIHTSAVFKPYIHYNTIYQSSNGTYYPNTYGIKIDKGDSAIVSCNYIKCTEHYGKSWGMHINESNYDSILCNTTDTNNIGIFFGGQCASTKLIANTMRANFRGMHLNNVAVIGTQTHSGNKWINYLDTVGAINLDTAGFGLSASLFRVNDTMGTVLYPYIPSWNSGWFFFTPGTAATCGSTCTADGSSAGDELYERSVAQGNSETEVYPDETKNLSEQYLHETLKADTFLLQSDTIYTNFYDLKEQSNIGKIRKVKDQLKSVSIYNDIFKQQMSEADSLIKIHIDSLQLLNQLALSNPVVSYSVQIESNRNQIKSIDSIRTVLIGEQATTQNAAIDSAKLINDSYTPTALPEENEKYINSMYILYLRYGQDSLFYYFNNILAIAQQCPYAGGGAVFVARNFVEFFNDSIQYDDDAICLQSGIFKMGHTQNSKQQLLPVIKIVPNPASNTVDIILKNTADGICNIEITNVLGKIVLNEKLSCNDKHKVLNIANLVTGVYIVKVKINDNFVQTNKLIISR